MVGTWRTVRLLNMAVVVLNRKLLEYSGMIHSDKKTEIYRFNFIPKGGSQKKKKTKKLRS